MMKKMKTIPKFKNREEEAQFWDTHDLTDYVDFSSATVGSVLNLEKGVTVRFKTEDLAKLRKDADRKGVGVTTLIRMLALEYLDRKPLLLNDSDSDSTK